MTHIAGPLLVLAGAGSGKTRVITYRIAHLIERGVDPRHIAALTFTNKAAAEMRERVAALVKSRAVANELTISTFHSLGLSILKRERKSLGYPRGFVIYDAADQLGVIRELMRSMNFGGTNSAQTGDRRWDVKAIQTRISLAKNAFIPPDAYEPAEGDDYDWVTAEIYPRYQAALRAFAAVDFDDLITATVTLFQSDPEVGARWRRAFRHVMVDEYQDTNHAQLLMVKNFVAESNNLCVVGDDDQSIYSWRGADTRNILQFERAFPGATAIVLDQNYRSTPTILEAANAVIANNVDRRGKELWSDKPAGDSVVAVVAPETETEAQFVAREIETLVANGRRYRDMAILYRSNLQTKLLEEHLRTHQIPYRMFGGQQFFERKEVKDVIAYLRVALSARDEISLRRIINYPARGIGATTLERLTTASLARRKTLWDCVDAASYPDSDYGIQPRAKHALAAFAELITNLRAEIDRAGGVAATRWLLEAIDLYTDLRAASPSLSAAQRRIDNVESLLRSLERFEERSAGKSALADYLRQLSLEASSDDDVDASDAVTMTTLHGAKGLEFPVVFLVGAEEELLPHARSLMPSVTDVSNPDHVADVSEERRLAYVGITRAMEKLYISRAEARTSRGRRRVRVPSRFLLEIPEHLLEHRDVAAEGAVRVEADEVADFFAQMGSRFP